MDGSLRGTLLLELSHGRGGTQGVKRALQPASSLWIGRLLLLKSEVKRRRGVSDSIPVNYSLELLKQPHKDIESRYPCIV